MKVFRILASCFSLIFACLVFSGAAQLEENSSIQEIDGLVRVQDIDPTILADMRYATENNFTGKKVYPVSVCVLRKETAEKLAAANAEFNKDGYRIKVWDAYRPPYVQKIFWDLVPDDRYVANPQTGGSKHNRGGAVDMTLVDTQGNELEMPSAFDDFSEKAARNSPAMSEGARKNVEYFSNVMAKHGFIPYEHEWWHFDDKDYENFPLVDVQLERFLDEPSSVLKVLNALDANTYQTIIMEAVSSEGFKARLTLWERKRGTQEPPWQAIGEAMDGVIGRNGLALPDEKMEGDGKTPSGIYSLGTAFGYGPSIQTGLVYRQSTENDFWVDDPQSTQYNQWVMGSPQAESFERMKRDDDLYRYGIVIEYNTDPVVPGKGSAIFMHVWRSADSPTAGCVALSEGNLLKILAWLNQSDHPAIVLLNR